MVNKKYILAFARYFVIAVMVAVLLQSSVAAALDKATQGLLFPMYGENGTACGGAGDAVTAVKGKDNEETIFRFLLSKGLTPYQTAGIMGNLRQESGFNPKAQQDRSKSVYPKDGVGFGLAQWTFTSRQQPLVDLARKMKVLPNTMDPQLAYLWKELTGSYKKSTLDPLKGVFTNSTHDDPIKRATFIFHNNYEGSADTIEMIGRRVNYGKDSYELMIKRGLFKDGEGDKVLNGATPTTTTGATEGEDGDVCADAAGDAVTVDGFHWPRAPLTKKGYDNGVVPVCKHPVKNGVYTKNNRYTTEYGITTTINTCHHDSTPAFDLMGKGGEAVYAITDGVITHRNSSYGGVPGCYSIQFKSTAATGGFYYWYGHMQDAITSIPLNKQIKAGTRIASIAKEDKGSSCWLGGMHLHIDSGCVDKQGVPHTGGNDPCRRPEFLQQLGKVYEALP
jgi:hypothetical protein